MKQHIQKNESNSIIYPTLGNKDKIIKIQDATEKELKIFLNQRILNSLKECAFKAKNKITTIVGNLDEEHWKVIYILPHRMLKDNKIKELQYKILFRYIGTNKLLYKMNKTASPRCVFCQMYEESIEHLFYE
jgi:predicted phosphodiesterase